MPASGCTPPRAPLTAAATRRWPRSCAGGRFPGGAAGADGYLGTYAPERRFIVAQPKGPRTWDGAPGERTWDIWTHSYLILGLLEATRISRSALPGLRPQDRRPVPACADRRRHRHHRPRQPPRHVGDGADGPGGGALFRDRGGAYLARPSACWRRPTPIPNCACCRARWPAWMPPRSRPARRTSCAGTWSAWRNCIRPPANRDYLRAVQVWGQHPRASPEPRRRAVGRRRPSFARSIQPPRVFSPHGYVETCSTLAWIQLNRELLAITGEADMPRKSNAPPTTTCSAAQAPNGEDWCYYIYPNGRRVHTTYWRCCKSSGAMALEELPGWATACTGRTKLALTCTAPAKQCSTPPRPAP